MNTVRQLPATRTARALRVGVARVNLASLFDPLPPKTQEPEAKRPASATVITLRPNRANLPVAA